MYFVSNIFILIIKRQEKWCKNFIVKSCLQLNPIYKHNRWHNAIKHWQIHFCYKASDILLAIILVFVSHAFLRHLPRGLVRVTHPRPVALIYGASLAEIKPRKASCLRLKVVSRFFFSKIKRDIPWHVRNIQHVFLFVDDHGNFHILYDGIFIIILFKTNF